MRKYTIPQNMSMEYMLSDHLGSTSLTTDAAGVKVSEMRYKPWGEVRYAWKNAPANTSPAYALTRYTFTGQYSYMDDPSTPASEGFGLMHYGARMYDPALGRFTSADTIVPGGVQGYDRYAYVNNNPIRYNDPTGHMCSDPEDPTPSCEGSAAVKTKVGNKMVSGNGKSGNGSKEEKEKEDIDEDWWENLANLVLPPIFGADGSKEEFFGTAAFQGGGVWGLTLITTKDGDAQFYYEHGLAVTVGPNISATLTRGLVYGIETAADYEGGATSGSISVELVPPISITGGGWESDTGDSWGFDYGGSGGVSLPIAVSGTHTIADPIGNSFQLEGAILFGCRLLEMCGR